MNRNYPSTKASRVTLMYSTLAIIGLLAASRANADYATTVLADNPAAYFRFQDNVVTPPPATATNLGSLGAAGNGSYLGVYTRPVAGAVGANTAVAFSNPGATTTAYVGSVNAVNNAALNPSGGFTIEAWVKPNGTISTLLSPVNSMSFTTGRSGYLIYQNAGTWQFRVGVTTSTTASILNGGTVLANQWQHLVGVYSGGPAGTMTLYVDGVAVGTNAAATYEVNNNAPFCIGGTSSPNRTFDGAVDEVAFYGAILSADTIAAHYAARATNAANYASQVLAAAPAGYWRLDEPADAIIVATNSGSLGAANNGTYRYWSANTTELTGPTFPGFATTNQVLQTSGTNGLVAIPALNLNANNVTFECWIKRSGSQGSYAGVLFHRGTAGGTATGIDFNGTTDALGYHWSDQANTYNWYSGLVPPDGAWAYVALAVTPDQATMYLYDGTTWSTAVNPVTHPVQAFADITRIGADQDASRFFTGLIDEAAIYGKTLSEGQLRTHALAGFGDPANNPPQFVTDPPTLSPSGTIYSTTPFSLAADAYGAPPLTFQWRHEGTNLPGATSRTFSRTSASAFDAGNYVVVVSNNFGAITSSVVAVTINPAVPPTIDVQPASRQVYSGGTARFSVAAGGTTPIAYQWKHAGTNLPGATGATLVVTNCTAAQAGSYQVGVTNVAGGLLSTTVNLSLFSPAAGSYEALVAGMKPLAYWRLGETSGATAFDYAGGYDGTYVNVAQNQSGAVVGEVNGAAGFDGASAYVTTGQPLLNNRAQFTVMGWLKRGAAHSLRGGYFGQNNLLEFGDASTGTSIEAWIDASGGNIITPWPWPDDQWGFIVLTGDGTAGRLYIDGKPAGSLASTVASYGTNGYSFNIGGGGIFNDPAVNMDYFNGFIDEVAVFNRALNAQEICALYLKGTGYAGAFEPSLTRITGVGEQSLTNVNFSSSDGGFTVETPGGSAEAAWGFDGTSWWSPGQSSAFGNDNVSYLISPPYSVTRSGALRLTFTHRYSFEIGFDGGAVEVSVNGGPWTYVPAAQFDQSGYNGTVGGPASLVGKRGFVDNSAGHPAYLTSSCVLAGVNAGATVNVRFVADYDNNTAGDLTPAGWQITTVQLSQGATGFVSVACPCGNLETKQGDITAGTWQDLGAGSAVISTTRTNQQYFRIQR